MWLQFIVLVKEPFVHQWKMCRSAKFPGTCSPWRRQRHVPVLHFTGFSVFWFMTVLNLLSCWPHRMKKNTLNFKRRPIFGPHYRPSERAFRWVHLDLPHTVVPFYIDQLLAKVFFIEITSFSKQNGTFDNVAWPNLIWFSYIYYYGFLL